MPHIAITMYPGRNDDIKNSLAKKMQDAMAEELNIDKKFISVSIEDIEKENWDENMKKYPDDIIFIKKDF